MSEVAAGTIVKIDADRKLVFGWASVIKDTSDKVLLDRQDDFIDSEDELEKAAYEYVLKSRDGGEMHIRKGVSTMVESVVLSKEKQAALGIPAGVIPVGWWVGFKVNDDRVWGEVKKGGYVGFSVHGTGKRQTTDMPIDKITEIEKCGCDDSAVALPQIAKRDDRYWDLMNRAQMAVVVTAIEKSKKRKKPKNKVAVVMREFKRGKLKSSSGKKVINPAQAMAIALAEQRAVSKGDSPGHAFRGNQWTRGKGGAGGGKAGGKPKMKRGSDKEITFAGGRSGNVREAAKRLMDGEEIDMPNVKGAHTLIKKLAKVATEMEKGGEKFVYDLCKVTVKGASAFCGGNKGIDRADMPQAKGEVVKGSKADKALKKQNAKRKAEGKDPKDEYDATSEFIAHMEKRGIKVGKPKTVRADKLKATQRNMEGQKVAGMMTAKDKKFLEEPIFVSRDGYVVDGHHRWAASLGLDMKDGKLGNNHRQNVRVIDAPISKILKEANRFTSQFGIKRKTVAASKKKKKR